MISPRAAVHVSLVILGLLALTLPLGCSSSAAGNPDAQSLADGSGPRPERDRGTADATNDAPQDATPSEETGPASELGIDDARPADAPSPGPDALSPCQPPTPPRADHIDPCLVAHDPQSAADRAPLAPSAVQAVTLRLTAQQGDVQRVVVRAWTGIERAVTMTKGAPQGDRDVFEAELPASARPVFYRFTLEDGTARATFTRAGLSSSTPSGTDDFMYAPAASQKTLHVLTTFSQPELRIRAGTGTTAHPLSAQGDGWFGATGLGALGQALSFYVRDAASGAEDHPPGGGDYRVPADLEEAWLYKGTVLDVHPDQLTAELIDAHTHPYAAGFVYDPQPLVTLLPPQGITHALTMVSGALATQRARLTAVHQANRWIVPLVWVRPQSHDATDVEALLADDGFKGLKFHPSVDGFPADSALMDSFMTLAQSRGVPVQIHSATDDNATPQRIVALANRFPAVKVVMVHTELGALDKTAALALISATDNVYAETSWTNPQSILQAMATLDSSRTLFGTDSTVDGADQFIKQSIANPQGQYVYTIPQVIAEVRAQAHPDAFENWARLTVIRLYDLRFRPEADLVDTDGDGEPDVTDGDDDNDGVPDANDADPR